MLEVQWENNYKKKQELINQVTEIPYWETEDLSQFRYFLCYYVFYTGKGMVCTIYSKFCEK